jgi:hypothetical protein
LANHNHSHSHSHSHHRNNYTSRKSMKTIKRCAEDGARVTRGCGSGGEGEAGGGRGPLRRGCCHEDGQCVPTAPPTATATSDSQP